MKTTINAKIVAHSVNEQGDELISVLATFPRIILAEVNTHRMLSKNTSSSRAIPFNKMVESIVNDPFIPIAWQKTHSGMQGTEYWEDSGSLNSIEEDWLKARNEAIIAAISMDRGGVTKQLANRLLEPFMWTTMVITGPKSGWDNFFKLRCPSYNINGDIFKSRKDAIIKYPSDSKLSDLDWLKINEGQAEIHIMDLAEKIYDAYNESTPRVLKPGDWHIPFLNKIFSKAEYHRIPLLMNTPSEEIIMNRVKISVAMAARTSYTVVGEEKGIDYDAMIGLHDRLLAQTPPHSSPLEHCARAMDDAEYNSFIKGKCEYMYNSEQLDADNTAKGWCNNFKGFIPYRYMVDNNIKD
jgi:hypothetical protein